MILKEKKYFGPRLIQGISYFNRSISAAAKSEAVQRKYDIILYENKYPLDYINRNPF